MDKYLIALTYLKGLGPILLNKLVKAFESPQTVWQTNYSDLKSVGLNKNLIESLINQRQKINPDLIIKQLNKERISAISCFDKGYPELLKQIYAPPPILYYRGSIAVANSQNILAVVGSRKITAYAKSIMPKLLEPLVAKDVIIVSGLAYGVDELAHKICLAGQTPTIAVVGSGLAWDYLYPRTNKKLALEIIKQGGLLLSELPPFTPVHPANFPRRNRIISGLAGASLIVEAGNKSGSLITAGYALEQNREVLAVPHNLDSENSLGVNNLIANGATMINSAQDILNIYNIPASENKITGFKIDLTKLTENEAIVYKMLSTSPIHIDKIAENSTLDTSTINSILIQMELNNYIKNLGGQNYIKL